MSTVDDLAAWADTTRRALVHISQRHPVDFTGVLAGNLIAATILAGTGRGIPGHVRVQVDRAIAEVREEVCSGCKPMSA